MANCNSSWTKLYMRYLNSAHHSHLQTPSQTYHNQRFTAIKTDVIAKCSQVISAYCYAERVNCYSWLWRKVRSSFYQQPASRAENALTCGWRGWYEQDSTSDRIQLWQHCTVLFPFVHGNGIPMGMGIIHIPIYIVPISTPMTYEIFVPFPWESHRIPIPIGNPIPMHISK